MEYSVSLRCSRKVRVRFTSIRNQQYGYLKRPRGSTGTSPFQTEKNRVQKQPKVQHGARRVLPQLYPPRSGPGTQATVPGSAWSIQETLALVDYILSCKLAKSDWPKTTNIDFWSRASKFIQDRALIRTGTLSQYNICLNFDVIYIITILKLHCFY